jgi:hypothetical protein
MLNASPKLLSRFAVFVALAMAVGLGTAIAQTEGPVATVPTEQKDDIRDYLTNHPEQARQLHENPSLINDPNWLSKNPQVQSYLEKHPDMKSTAATNPNHFVDRAEKGTLRTDHQALDRSNNYLDKHPDIKSDLEKNPKLIDDPNYLAKHPALKEELAKHPYIREEAMNHPEKYKEASERNSRYNGRHKPKMEPAAKAHPVAKKGGAAAR